MQQEVSQLISEIDRVAGQTNFNGVSLLDGTFTAQTFQVGANVGDTIVIDSVVDATAAGLGLDDGSAQNTSGTVVTAALLANDLTINGVDVGAVGQDAALQAAAITATGADITASAEGIAFNLGAFGDTGTADGETLTLAVGAVNMTTAAAAAGSGVTAAMMQTAVDGQAANLATAGITVTGTVAGGNLSFTKTDGSTVAWSVVDSGTAGAPAAGGFGQGTSGNIYGRIASITSTGADLVIGGNDATKAGLVAGTTYTGENVSSVSGANSLITVVDAALDSVNGSRATLGAIQNRFESVVTSLQTSAESLSAARSRIQDTDFAAETANLTKSQILQQAGMAMMAQANSLPQSVLSLLQ
jgi:flagellin